MSLMNAPDQKIIAHKYDSNEGFHAVYPWFSDLRHQGLSPVSITMDGEQSVMKAIHLTWPQTLIQRCLYHLQHQGMLWTRITPTNPAGSKLRDLLLGLCNIQSLEQHSSFVQSFRDWLDQYKSFILCSLKPNSAFLDLKRAMVMIQNAIPNMFHYLLNSNIPRTTNALESFHSRLKSDYPRHRGLSKNRRISYLNWYCFFKNSNTS